MPPRKQGGLKKPLKPAPPKPGTPKPGAPPKRVGQGVVKTRAPGKKGRRGLAADLNSDRHKNYPAMKHGSKIDKEFEYYVRYKRKPKSQQTQYLIDFLERKGILCTAAQVYVKPPPGSITPPTRLDAVAIDNRPPESGGTKSNHFILEIKTHSGTRDGYRIHSKCVNEQEPYKFMWHTQTDTPNTVENKYFNQLKAGMEMYAHVKGLAPGTLLHGALVVSCYGGKDTAEKEREMQYPLWYEVFFNYKPGTGANTISPETIQQLNRVDGACTAVQPKKRAKKNTPSTPREGAKGPQGQGAKKRKKSSSKKSSPSSAVPPSSSLPPS